MLKKIKGRKMTPHYNDGNSSKGKTLKRAKKLRSELKKYVTKGGFENELETTFVGIHWRYSNNSSTMPRNYTFSLFELKICIVII